MIRFDPHIIDRVGRRAWWNGFWSLGVAACLGLGLASVYFAGSLRMAVLYAGFGGVSLLGAIATKGLPT